MSVDFLELKPNYFISTLVEEMKIEILAEKQPKNFSLRFKEIKQFIASENQEKQIEFAKQQQVQQKAQEKIQQLEIWRTEY